MIELEPTVADQELDTRATTGVIYWEGSQDVRATRRGATLGGEAYIELTGYAGGWRDADRDHGPAARPSGRSAQYCGHAPRTDAARRLCRPGHALLAAHDGIGWLSVARISAAMDIPERPCPA